MSENMGMVITRLHLVLLFLTSMGGLLISYPLWNGNVSPPSHRRQTFAPAPSARSDWERPLPTSPEKTLELTKAREEKRLLESARKNLFIAEEAVQFYKEQGMDTSEAQSTLEEGRQALQDKDGEKASLLFDETLDLAETSPPRERTYTVQRGDTLWKIAAMKEHHGNPTRWHLIWRYNQNNISDFDIIRPHQEILIPPHDWEPDQSGPPDGWSQFPPPPFPYKP